MNVTPNGGGRPPLVIVGYGHVAQHCYVPALRRAGWPVAAVVDPAPFRHPDGAWCGPGVQRYDSVAALAAAVPAHRGAVAINLTPIPVHLSVNEQLLHAGFHVYSEKPPAPDERSWRGLTGLARDRGLVLVSAPHLHRGWTADRLAAIVADRVLGEPLALHVDASKTGSAAGGYLEPHRRWFYESGAGAVRDLGPYPLGLLVRLFGRPARAVWRAGGRNVSAPPGSPDPHEHAVRLFDTHALLADWTAGPIATVHVAYGRHRIAGPSFVMYCEQGRVECDLWRVDGPVQIYRTPRWDEVHHETVAAPHDQRGGYDLAVAFLAGMLADPRPLRAHWDEVAAILAVVEAAGEHPVATHAAQPVRRG